MPFVAPGETVRVEITRRHKGYSEARLLAVEEPSPQRVEPPCPYFGRCGGCSYQHLTSTEQLRIKGEQVAQVLRRVGKFAEPPVVATVPSPRDYEYRNRITVHVRDGVTGFFGENGRELVDVERCPIAEPNVNEALARFRARPWMRSGHCTLRNDPQRRTFHQTNDRAATELLRLVRELTQSGDWRHLVDAYCGAGFFARDLRDRFDTVVGLEWDERAVAEAQKGAAAHERYIAGDVAGTLAEVLFNKPQASTLLVVDPPAEGLAAGARQAILDGEPAALVYVSCDPSTLARDLKELARGYELVSVTPLDMFPQTAQIEAVAFLRVK